jgi:hypothetical protein
MSRVSLSQRIRTMIETAAAIDPQAVAVHRLSLELRRSYDSWRAENKAIHAAIEAAEGPGASYARIADGQDVTLPMPSDVARALNVPAPPVFADDMRLDQLERMYAEMIRANPVRTNKRKNFRAIVNEN